MKATINKKDILNATKMLAKISKADKVFLLAKDAALDVIVTNPEYVKITIPAKNIEEGVLSIARDLFERIPSLRKDTLKLSSASNTLQVDAGSKLTLYCMDTGDEDLSIPDFDEEDSAKFVLPPAGVGNLAKILSSVKFSTFDEKDTIFAQLKVDGDKFSLGLADSVHCAFYISKDAISKKPFNFVVSLQHLRDVVSYVDSKMSVKVNLKLMQIRSENLVCQLSAMSDIGDTVDEARTHLEKGMYKKGSITVNRNKLTKVIDSISVISKEGDECNFTFKGTKALLKMDTKSGKAKDTLELKDNTLGNIELAVPLKVFKDALSSVSSYEGIEIKLSTNDSFILVSSKDKTSMVKCIVPAVS